MSTNPSAYDALPEIIKSQVPEEEWLWLSDAEKANLERELMEPKA